MLFLLCGSEFDNHQMVTSHTPAFCERISASRLGRVVFHMTHYLDNITADVGQCAGSVMDMIHNSQRGNRGQLRQHSLLSSAFI